VIRLAVSQNRSLMVVAAVAVAMTTVTMSVAMPAVTASVAAVAMWSKFL
jgi:hypothetical protein